MSPRSALSGSVVSRVSTDGALHDRIMDFDFFAVKEHYDPLNLVPSKQAVSLSIMAGLIILVMTLSGVEVSNVQEAFTQL